MIHDIYETTVLKGYSTTNIRHELEVAGINSELELLTSDGSFKALIDKKSTIKPFTQPITVKDTTYIDLRGIASPSDTSDKFHNPKYMFAMVQARLSSKWMLDGASDIRSLGHFPSKVFGRWIADNLTMRLNLSPELQLNVLILATYWYYCQSLADDVVDIHKVTSYIMKSSYTSSSTVLAVISDLGKPMVTIADFCDALQTLDTDNDRYATVNPGLILSVLVYGWLGAHSREVVAVALEHPPTFVAMLNTSIVDHGYRKSGFAKFVRNVAVRGEDKDFSIALSRTLRVTKD